MKWADFAGEAPELARFAVDRFEETGLALLGTIRPDGWPRISPLEPVFFKGHLVLGMTWYTNKALDLLRDPRCALNTLVFERDGSDGEIKLRGRAFEVGPDMRGLLEDHLQEKYGWRPSEKSHQLWMDITAAAFLQYVGDLKNVVKEWREGHGLRQRFRRWTLSGYVDLPVQAQQ